MATCINKNTPEFKSISESLGSPIRANGLIVAWQKVNNTDALPTLEEAMDFNDANKVYHNLKTREFEDALYNNLRRIGAISKFHGKYYVVSTSYSAKDGMNVFNPNKRNDNLLRIANYFRMNNIPLRSIKMSYTKSKKGLRFAVDTESFTPQDIIPAARGFDTPHAREVVRHLMRMFPQVSVTMLSVKDAKILYDDLPIEQKAELPFDQINSFYVDGQAVLIKGRVTDDTAIEEILHPFVDSLYLDNPELFNNLLAEAKLSFPVLSEQIRDSYTDRRGFSQKHRDLELVTQALSRHFNDEFTNNETKSFKDAVKKFMEWFMNIIKNYVKREKKYPK